MYCSKCGKYIADESIFCEYCGTKVNHSDQPTTQKPESRKEEIDAKHEKIENTETTQQQKKPQTFGEQLYVKIANWVLYAAIVAFAFILIGKFAYTVKDKSRHYPEEQATSVSITVHPIWGDFFADLRGYADSEICYDNNTVETIKSQVTEKAKEKYQKDVNSCLTIFGIILAIAFVLNKYVKSYCDKKR